MLTERSTFSGRYVQTIIKVAELSGAQARPLYTFVSASEDALNDPLFRVDSQRVIELMHHCIGLTGRTDFGLLVGSAFKPGTFDALGYAVMCCETLRDAILLNARYQPINQTLGNTSLDTEEHFAIMRWVAREDDHDWLRPITEAVFAGYARLGRWLTWRDRQPIRHMRFRHAEPADVHTYQALFDCPLEFAASENAMRFDEDFLATRLQQHDAYMLTLLTERLDKQLALLESRVALHTDILKLLNKHPQQVPTLTQVADMLNMSERTIKRHLKAEATSFSRLLEEHRKQRAMYFLTQTEITVTELAEQLGYREPCSFQRAFKQWFGKTPGEYRSHSRQHLGGLQSMLAGMTADVS